MAAYSIKAQNAFKHFDFIFYDLFCTIISFFLAYYLRYFDVSDFGEEKTALKYLAIVLFMQVTVGISFKLYKNILKRGYIDELVSTVKLCFMTTGCSIVITFILHFTETPSRLFVGYMACISLTLIYFERCLWKSVLRKRFKNRKIDKQALFIVSDFSHATEIVRSIRAQVTDPYTMVGIALSDGKIVHDIDGVPVVCDFEGAAEYLKEVWVDEVFLYTPNIPSPPVEFFRNCANMNLVVHRVLEIEDIDSKEVFVKKIANKTVLTTGYVKVSFEEAVIKRVFDIIGGIVGCFATLIIAIFIGPIIYISSPGPIFFKQTRIGRNGKRFTFYKFRSMVLDAESKKKELALQNRNSDGMMFKMDFDPRIIGNKILPNGKTKTGIGDFIRRTSLDEFPQFFNVLKGDMSMVGTRPPTEDEWEKYDYHHRARLIMRPGITGMWQVSGRSNIRDFEEVVKLDTLYINTFSIRQDIKIILKTVFSVFKKEGAV